MTKLMDIVDKHDCYGCESNWDLQDNRKSDDEIVEEVKALIVGLIKSNTDAFNGSDHQEDITDYANELIAKVEDL